MINSPPTSQRAAVVNAVKKTISISADLARDAEALARAEGKTLSAVIEDALRQSRIERRAQELRGLQGYWSRKARDKGILADNETGKGDHRHVRGREMPYEFKSIAQLRRDFERDVKAAGGKDEENT